MTPLWILDPVEHPKPDNVRFDFAISASIQSGVMPPHSTHEACESRSYHSASAGMCAT
jgi:hypothetical protein